jgi:hypothetical protein
MYHRTKVGKVMAVMIMAMTVVLVRMPLIINGVVRESFPTKPPAYVTQYCPISNFPLFPFDA